MKRFLYTLYLSFARKCPNCHKKGLFRQYLNIEKSCRNCGLELDAYREGIAGPVIINYSISLIITVIYIVGVYQANIMGDTLLTLSAGTLAITMIFLLFPIVKTYWIHLMYNTGYLKSADKQNVSS